MGGGGICGIGGGRSLEQEALRDGEGAHVAGDMQAILEGEDARPMVTGCASRE